MARQAKSSSSAARSPLVELETQARKVAGAPMVSGIFLGRRFTREASNRPLAALPAESTVARSTRRGS